MRVTVQKKVLAQPWNKRSLLRGGERDLRYTQELGGRRGESLLTKGRSHRKEHAILDLAGALGDRGQVSCG